MIRRSLSKCSVTYFARRSTLDDRRADQRFRRRGVRLQPGEAERVVTLEDGAIEPLTHTLGERLHLGSLRHASARAREPSYVAAPRVHSGPLPQFRRVRLCRKSGSNFLHWSTYSLNVAPPSVHDQKSSSNENIPLPAYCSTVMPGEVDRRRAGLGVVAAVLHVDDDPTRVVDHVPLVRGVHLAVVGHRRLDPRAHRLATLLVAEDVLDVRHVFGEARVAPHVPVLTDRTELPVRAERGLDFVTIESHAPTLGHGITASTARRRRRGSDP